MPVSIVVGGQYGSEGKGKVSHYLSVERKASVVIRCGGTNSGHTVIDEEGQAQIFQQLPTAAILPEVKLALCAGTYIDIKILKKELERSGAENGRLMIDPFAIVISEHHKKLERDSGLIDRIGSTGSGTGAAVIARITRDEDVKFAKDCPELSGFITDVTQALRERLLLGERIIIEGTQGFGLSPFHSGMNPYVTSRDTTAAGFLSEVGLSPLDVDEVVMVIRAFPIRVSGTSGPLVNEIDWKTISIEGSHDESLKEFTSVSKETRRVARFDPIIVRRAIKVNRPTAIVLNHLDYINKYASIHHDTVKSFIQDLAISINFEIEYLGFGPSFCDCWRQKK